MSVSLFAGFPQWGQVVFTKLSDFESGDFPSGVNSTSYGSSTGNWFSGTGTIPQSSQ